MGDGRNLRLGALRQRGRIFWFALLASISWAVAASPFGCGLDDTAITQFDTADGSADGTIGEGGPVIGDGGADVVVCTPETCNSYPSVCRAGLPNGCGVDNLDCTNACPPDQGCIRDSGTCDGPPICHDAGAPGGNCETIINPGNLIEAGCGECANPGYTCASSTCVCAAGGTVCGTSCCNGPTPNCAAAANTCCKLKTCADYAGPPQQCGAALDNGCGATNLNCSSSCGAGGTQCGPSSHTCDLPPTCTNMGQPGGSCLTLTGSDGLSSNCGTCVTAGFTCTANVCQCGSSTTCLGGQLCFSNACCTPVTGTACNNKCGTVTGNCGQPIDCGDCNNGDMCEGPVQCKCGTGSNSVNCNPGKTCDTIGGGSDKCD